MSKTLTRELHVDVEDLLPNDMIQLDDGTAIRVGSLTFEGDLEDDYDIVVQSMSWVGDGSEAQVIVRLHSKARVRIRRPRPTHQIKVSITPDFDDTSGDLARDIETLLGHKYPKSVIETTVLA